MIWSGRQGYRGEVERVASEQDSNCAGMCVCVCVCVGLHRNICSVLLQYKKTKYTKESTVRAGLTPEDQAPLLRLLMDCSRSTKQQCK